MAFYGRENSYGIAQPTGWVADPVEQLAKKIFDGIRLCFLNDDDGF